MMMRIIAMVLPCREVVEAVSSDGIAVQPWWRRPLFAIHLAGCGFCSRFVRQMELIRRVLVEKFSSPKNEGILILQERILSRLRREP